MLHVFAERVGTNGVVPLQLDEVRELEILVRGFPRTLPCPTCQRHSAEYLYTHPLDWAALRGAAVAPVARKWFYDFHHFVNGQKASGVEVSPPVESLSALYGAVPSLEVEFNILSEELTRAVNFNWVKHDASIQIRRHLTTLRRLMGI